MHLNATMLPDNRIIDRDFFLTTSHERLSFMDGMDHSRIPPATAITSEFNDISNLQTMSDYESKTLEHFLICVSYMRGHSLYLDLRDLPYSIDKQRNKIDYNMDTYMPCCSKHSVIDDPRMIYNLESVHHSHINAIRGSLHSFANIEDLKKYKFKSYVEMRLSIARAEMKRYLPVFGTFFRNIRDHNTWCSGYPLVKQQFIADEFSLDIQMVCSVCQTERFFCNLYKHDRMIDYHDQEPKAAFKTNNKRYFMYDNADIQRPSKRVKLDHENIKHLAPTDDDTGFDTILPEIWERHILNRIITRKLRENVRKFCPREDSLGSMTNYLRIEKISFFDKEEEEEKKGHHVEAIENERTENTTECLTIDDSFDILETMKTLSSVCKGWNAYCKRHFVWRILYQASHTLYNSARVNITKECAMESIVSKFGGGRTMLGFQRKDFMRSHTSSVHGLYDCHVFATYAFNVFSSLLFTMINQSTNKLKMEAVFRKHGVYHSLMRLLCTDAIRNWKITSNETTKEFDLTLETCYQCFRDVLNETKFDFDEETRQIMHEMYAISFRNVAIEKEINPMV